MNREKAFQALAELDDRYIAEAVRYAPGETSGSQERTLYKKKNLANISKETPIAIMAGEEDPVGVNGKGPRDLAKLYTKLGVKDVTLKLYPKMRHEIHNEIGKEQVWSDLKDFLLA